jgi:hypothetical protein
VDTAADVAEGRCMSAAAVLGKKLLIFCTRVPLLTLRICALLHGFNHVHLDLGYFSTKGLSST